MQQTLLRTHTHAHAHENTQALHTRRYKLVHTKEHTHVYYYELLEYPDWELENHGKIMRRPVLYFQ